MPEDALSLEYARSLDAVDPLASFRERFYHPADTLYFDGNSLGLLSKDAEAAVLNGLDQWKRLAIDGWMKADPAWFTFGEELGRLVSSLVGAEADQVIVTGTTTVNLHSLVSTFYQPAGKRTKIVATDLDFPSDIYALQSQIALKGGDPETDLVRVASRDGRNVDEDDLIAAFTDEVALILLPSVLYRSGQLLDIGKLTAAAHERGILIGFDCAHSVGSMPHYFDRDDVDFAFWCGYKYLNGGPGSVGALYVNRRHFGTKPGLSGWWGYHKERQFDMLHTWESAPAAGAWQISTVPLLSTTPLLGSLRMFHEAGIERLREKSLKATDYLVSLLNGFGLLEAPYNFRIGTPLDHARRGGHIAVEHDAGPRIAKALKQVGVVPDFRPPDVIRLAPIPLYTSYEDVWTVIQKLREVVDTGAYLRVPGGRELVA
ncbi:MAG: kynureninase [Thermomicrobiales bacterium]